MGDSQKTELRNELVGTRCIFCGQGTETSAKPCGAGNEEHCILCRKARSREADPCITENQGHIWRRGHDFQRVPIR